MEIKRQYIIDERNRKVAVQLDIETFERIEEALENYGLIQLMQEESDDELLELVEIGDRPRFQRKHVGSVERSETRLISCSSETVLLTYAGDSKDRKA